MKKRDIELSFQENTSFCTNYKRNDKRWNALKDYYDLFVFYDFPNSLNPFIPYQLGDKSILVLSEPPSVIPNQYDLTILKNFARVLTWRDDWAGNENMRKFYYPVLKKYQGGDPFIERKLSCMICNNKSSLTPGELYSERKRIIKFFKKDSQNFDLFGTGWNKKKIANYQGQIPYKYDTLKHYRFNFCLENIKGEKGYITEKIFDAFEAGCIPIYLGPSNIDEYIPHDCYINYAQFPSLKHLKQFMLDFTEDEYHRYIENIKNYLESREVQKFSVDHYSQIILKEIFERRPSCNLPDQAGSSRGQRIVVANMP
ncbi:MAG: hypothetical protein K9M07_05120 [Simkaniaceae bacterium]|nr:hypothetical protein [Simkaniaceae bacterium]